MVSSRKSTSTGASPSKKTFDLSQLGSPARIIGKKRVSDKKESNDTPHLEVFATKFQKPPHQGEETGNRQVRWRSRYINREAAKERVVPLFKKEIPK